MRKISLLGSPSECQILASRESTDREGVKKLFFSDTSATQMERRKFRVADISGFLSYLTSTSSILLEKYIIKNRK